MQKRLALLSFVLPLVTTITNADPEQSTHVLLKENRFFYGHVVKSQRAYDLLACARLCLARVYCDSFNFENVENGTCEMTSAKRTTRAESLIYIQGYVFGQLINREVSLNTLFPLIL